MSGGETSDRISAVGSTPIRCGVRGSKSEQGKPCGMVKFLNVGDRRSLVIGRPVSTNDDPLLKEFARRVDPAQPTPPTWAQPRAGWIKVIRTALGMTSADLGRFLDNVNVS